ncbi:MAG: GFA family protein [Erythrobacter sp.]
MAKSSAQDQAVAGQCPCGACKIELQQMPSVRFYCHCTICQSVYPSGFGDATLMLASKVSVLTPDAIAYTQHMKKGGLQRGTCRNCDHPVLAHLDSPIMPKLAFVPSAIIPDQSDKPQSARHIFYGTRAADVQDNLPKTHGDAASMMVFTPSVLKVVFGG